MLRALVVTLLVVSGRTAAAQPGGEWVEPGRPAVAVDARCEQSRARAVREAEAMLDPDDRFDALAHLPDCAPGRVHVDPADVEISDNQRTGAVIANVFVGYGIGQAIEGRWGKTGWIFTLGEMTSATLLFVGLERELAGLGDFCLDFDQTTPPNCPPPREHPSGKPFLIAGMVGLVAFRVASIADAVRGASAHNRRVRERAGLRSTIPVIAPTTGGATGGVMLRF